MTAIWGEKKKLYFVFMVPQLLDFETSVSLTVQDI